MEKITHRGNIIEVVQKEVDLGTKIKTFEYARRSPGVRLIIPVGDKILIPKEFRFELNTYDYHLPGGKVFDTLEEYNQALEQGANIVEASKFAGIKEAKEEVGIDIKNLEFFHKSVCGTTVIWDLYYFVVHEFAQTIDDPEAGEDIHWELFDKKDACAMCLDGRIGEERSALVLLRFLKLAI